LGTADRAIAYLLVENKIVSLALGVACAAIAAGGLLFVFPFSKLLSEIAPIPDCWASADSGNDRSNHNFGWLRDLRSLLANPLFEDRSVELRRLSLALPLFRLDEGRLSFACWLLVEAPFRNRRFIDGGCTRMVCTLPAKVPQ
jgi:hypothetical protein